MLESKVHNRNLVAWAKHHPEVVVLSGDLTGSTEIAGFRDAYPDRFFSMGMAEQNMLSFAGGLAREGYVPMLHTFAVFMYRRALDQLSMSVCYPNLKVRLFGFLPGVTTPGGVSHQAIDDIGVLSAIPNLSILEVGDATDVETALDPIHAIDGPVYIRMIRGEIPRLFPADEPLQFNRARVLSTGNDLAVISSGVCTQEAIGAVAFLKEQGLAVEHLHVSTLKPFDDPQISETLGRQRHGVITLENHTVLGGLGSRVANRIAEEKLGVRLIKLGLHDTYAHGASYPYLKAKYALDGAAVIAAAERLTGQTFDLNGSLPEVTATQQNLRASEQLEAL
ncbi:transketolase family protein [Pseudohoeflea coraliihabitans]|uniref:Transketolase n=1 Tax=Pseudohoeflea coraliihabitans TaxID=2860393 RepID=A0ABS6WJH1_9HYPH|nr:transketolase C-terminal domain-containing protein [Pseudohoeflea sp. DP4N28-3]MBW3095995.1 transketolase [Pseudohoeflea sp. DP4N28-3]